MQSIGLGQLLYTPQKPSMTSAGKPLKDRQNTIKRPSPFDVGCSVMLEYRPCIVHGGTMLSSMLKQSMGHLTTKLRWAFQHEVWAVGLVAQSAQDILDRGIVKQVRWLPETPPWTFLADPMVCEGADGPELYVEHMDFLDGKGTIWSAPFRPSRAGHGWASPRPTLTAAAHLSFPQVWPGAAEVVTCESWEAGGVGVFRRDADGGWRQESPLLKGIPAVDPVIYEDARGCWLFCTHAGPTANRDLHLYHRPRGESNWTPHPANPVISDISGARPAGPLFMANGYLIRPAQDCSDTYGGAVRLQGILNLSMKEYTETPLRRLPPLPPYTDGLHTLCPAGDWTVIDGKRWRTHPIEPLRKLLIGRRNRLRRAQLRTHAENT